MLGVAFVVQPTAAAAASCTVRGPDPARVSMTPNADGTPAYAQWLGQAHVSAANDAIQKAVQAQFGLTDGKETAAELARRGYIGSTVDHNTRTIVTVVTPEYRAKAAALQAKIDAAPLTRAYRTALIVGCYSGKRLAAAADLLHGRAWHPQAAQASFSFAIEANDSRLHVSFDPGSAAAAGAARTQLGELAVVTLGGSSRAGRLDDGEAHYGGAGVRSGSGALNSNICTTSFVVRRNADGQRGGLSAGHCFNNGNQVWSSTQFWGAAWGEAGYPTWDMIGVSSASETYDNSIHVDPCCPAVRNVTARKIPAINDNVCLSGMVTRAVCGLIVNNLNAELCDAAGCTTGLMRARRANDITVRGGDSGGPVYQRSGASNAVALGMIIGFNDGGRNLLGEKLNSIETHLGVTVLTS
ncbi:hypothetical protein Ais01nite_41840 [Asanoa ishikariensis]|nr:hypothetical protein Ais01nite_41840 [Asanoa ishikariensis]